MRDRKEPDPELKVYATSNNLKWEIRNENADSYGYWPVEKPSLANQQPEHWVSIRRFRLLMWGTFLVGFVVGVGCTIVWALWPVLR